MFTIPYQIVDVFSSTAYKGNPLAVVDNTANSLSSTQMRLMARQFNLSETTFVCSPEHPEATWRLRSFLPNGEEVFGAGHNSLGAWWWIASFGLLGGAMSSADTTPRLYHQQLGEDVLPVIVSKSVSAQIMISMRQGQPQFLQRHDDPGALAQSLGISVRDIGLPLPVSDAAEPQVVTTSPARHLLVPVRTREVLDTVIFNKELALQELARTQSDNSGIYVFTTLDGNTAGTSDKVPRYVARFFSPGMLMEDPATGSAAGPLAAYLHVNGALGSAGNTRKEIEVLQGLKTGRECVMRLSIDIDEESPLTGIRISGTGVLVAEGNIRVPAPDTAF
ncbi:hypothetical protein ETB97_003562 [Aspergillus alliaceus]|uniref:Uncharacterized protein n=1 Tax=Petromyces alliaceus TaxID=209559 RepID=A0A8H6E4D2_PETAA|nr:hypothetical protein ETB97_003562 [Aspergillus burnettii]